MLELKITIELCRVDCGFFRRQLQQYCHLNDLDLTIKEEKGLFRSLFLVTIAGPQSALNQAHNDLIRWVEKVNYSTT